MKGHGRRRYLQAIGATAATGLASATAGCSTLDGLLGSGSRDIRPLVAHPGWFGSSNTAGVGDATDPIVVAYEESAALREHSDTLPDWLVESDALFELDAAVDRWVLTILPAEVYTVEYVDEEALATAATESETYRSVPDVDGYHGMVGDGYCAVTGDGRAMGVGFPDGQVPDRPTDELLAAYARLLENRPSEFTAGTENLDQLETLYDAVGSATMGSFEMNYGEDHPYDARARAFEVGNDRTTVNIAVVGDDIDPAAFKDREMRSPNRDFSDYDDIEVSESEGVVLLTGTTPTEEFEKLAPE